MKTSSRFHRVAPRGVLPAFFTAITLAFVAFNGGAQTVTLAPGDNSSIQVNTTGTNAGVVNWDINGNDILNPAGNGLQWFYYSFASGTPAGIQNFGTAVSSGITKLSPDSESFGTTYTGSGMSLQATYTLTGSQPGSGNSDFQQGIQLINNSGSQMVLHFFEYANFTVPNPSVSLFAINTHPNPLYYLAQVSGVGVNLNEYIQATVNPGANEGTITPSLASLSTPGFNLIGSPAVTTNGPGGAWLFEWDVTLNQGGSFDLLKDINATPEPGVLPLVALGLAAFGAFRILRRRSAV
jgi:hypothetical protein